MPVLDLKPVYFVHGYGPRTGKFVSIPVYDVPESKNTVEEDAKLIGEHLRRFGWTQVKVIDVS